MKVDIFSDPHLDMWMRCYDYEDVVELLDNHYRKNPDSNTVIFAGDAGNGLKWYRDLVRYLSFMYDNVIDAYGNHDFYGGEILPFELLAYSRVIEGKKFTAVPLFTNFRNSPFVEMEAMHGISDFGAIKGMEGFAGVNVYKDLFEKSVEFIRAEQPDVVVTHWSPSSRSIHPRYIGQSLNGYFTNDIDSFVEEINADLWVHGHTHDPAEYQIMNTRVVCHPVGYPMENTKHLDIQPIQVNII